MPANTMKNAARLKFSGNNIKVPDGWSRPSGDPAGKHYGDAFKPGDGTTMPCTLAPPLFTPHTMNRFHTDVQKMLSSAFAKYLDGILDAIAMAWQQSQALATMPGVMITGPTAALGVVAWPPLTPLIMATAPKGSPGELRYSMTIANVIGQQWGLYTATIKVPGLPLYPAYAAFPGPLAIPVPNIPVPMATMTQVPTALDPNVMKNLMITQHGDPTAMYHKELFDAVCDAFDKAHKVWLGATLVTNIMPILCPVPTFAPPYVPVGPVVGGTAAMIPGGLTTIWPPLPPPMPAPPPPTLPKA